ncbi:MAG: hypothetical protein M1834_002163 [Cirrosporium novae-zelandiae]|nr:MAG: hypothetical protein M1834_002163 [Cirrosporium novae-zelandiae]
MSTKEELEALLRFLSQDAKLPLATAMRKVKDLQKADLTSSLEISRTDLKTLERAISDSKIAKQVHNAAKHQTKKRPSDSTSAESSSKRTELSGSSMQTTSNSITLPSSIHDTTILSSTTIITNRAPLFLAFTVTLLKYTMPLQPLSSRLSLAQAVVSMNSRSKAISLGLEGSKSAEEEGWGQGQPLVKIMRREVRVLRRYYLEEQDTPSFASSATLSDDSKYDDTKNGSDDEQDTMKVPKAVYETTFWALDLEALRSSAKSGWVERPDTTTALPIYTPQFARSYLLKSFSIAHEPSAEPQIKGSKLTASALIAEKERALALLLGALEILFSSWASVLSAEDLDSRSWGWYVQIRPEVQSGPNGWGQKGGVKLSDILKLKREVK